MRRLTVLRTAAAFAVALGGTAFATPITTLSPLSSNGSGVFAVYVFSEAADSLNLSEASPNGISNIFCNHSNGSCTAAVIGQTVNLGNTDPGLIFSLTDVSVANIFRTDAFASDGYAHDLVSSTVDASDPGAVAAAYALYGQGALPSAAAASIAALGLSPETVVTFVAWEDRLHGDYDYNDLIFAFTDPAVAVTEPATLALFGMGLFGLAMFRRYGSQSRLV